MSVPKTVEIVHRSGVWLQVTVDNQQLRAVVAMPRSLRSGVMEGLLGNFNSDKSDDFMAFNGGQYSAGTMASGDVYTWGKTCK